MLSNIIKASKLCILIYLDIIFSTLQLYESLIIFIILVKKKLLQQNVFNILYLLVITI